MSGAQHAGHSSQYPRLSGPPPPATSSNGGYASGGYAQDHHLDDAFDATPFGDDAAAGRDSPAQSPYYNDRQHMPSVFYNQQPDTRPPPPSGPAPAYARIFKHNFYSLRPVVMAVCFISIIYLLFIGVSDFRTASGSGITQKLKMFEILQGALFMVALGVELLGFTAAYTQRLPLARIYSFLSLGAYGAVLASQIIGIVVVFRYKTDVINSCVNYYTTGNGADDAWLFGSTGASANGNLSQADATSYCNSLWSRTRTWEIVWLIIAALVGAFFVLLSFAYARQLADPSSVRIRQRPTQPAVWSAPPYDPEGAYRYPPGPNNPYAYPPQPAPLYGGADGPAPPDYEGRRSMEGYDLDSKDPSGAFAQHGRAYQHAHNDQRPGSSRGARRDSSETLQGDAQSVKGAAARHYDDDDGTPRV